MSGFLPGGSPFARRRAAGAAGITPDQIAGLQLWLKADAITGLADGDAITTWTDSSGNGRNATQATAGAKPTYKTGIINGKPVARFDGGDSLSRADSQLWLTSVTAFAVWKQTDLSVSPEVFSNGLGIYYQTNSTLSAALHGVGALGFGIQTATDWMIDVLRHDAAAASGSRWRMAHNGALLTSASTLVPNTSTTFGIGYNSWDNANRTIGDIAEIIIYDSALSDANRQAVEAYLSAKYGIALA